MMSVFTFRSDVNKVGWDLEYEHLQYQVRYSYQTFMSDTKDNASEIRLIF